MSYLLFLLILVLSHYFVRSVKLFFITIFFLAWAVPFFGLHQTLRDFFTTSTKAFDSWAVTAWALALRIFFYGRRNLYLGDISIYVSKQATTFNLFFFSWSFMCRAILLLYIFFVTV